MGIMKIGTLAVRQEAAHRLLLMLAVTGMQELPGAMRVLLKELIIRVRGILRRFRPEQLLSAHQVCLPADDDHCHGRRGASGV